MGKGSGKDGDFWGQGQGGQVLLLPFNTPCETSCGFVLFYAGASWADEHAAVGLEQLLLLPAAAAASEGCTLPTSATSIDTLVPAKHDAHDTKGP